MEEEHRDVLEPTNYGDQKYWDKRYTEKYGQRFEWLQPYNRLKPHIENCLPKGKDSRILNLGCGNSSLQQDLYEDGYRFTAGNDISATVIQQMEQQSRIEKGYVQLCYDVMDVRSMTYLDRSFDLVIDKSTIDSLMCSDCPLSNVAQMIEGAYRVLQQGGYYLTISYSEFRREHFEREHVSFQIQHKVLKRLDKDGLELTNHLYICKKNKTLKHPPEWRAQFYANLKKQQEKQYPPL